MDVTTETFERDVVQRSRELPVVVDFWAAWCGPCRTLGPVIEGEVEKRTGRLELVKINIDAEQALAARFGIQSIPTVAVFRDGEPVTGFVGAYPPTTIGTLSSTCDSESCNSKRCGSALARRIVWGKPSTKLAYSARHSGRPPWRCTTATMRHGPAASRRK